MRFVVNDCGYCFYWFLVFDWICFRWWLKCFDWDYDCEDFGWVWRVLYWEVGIFVESVESLFCYFYVNFNDCS